MNDLIGPPAELRFTLTIKRAATGKEETYEMVGHSLPELEEKEPNNGDDTQHGSPQRGD
jgi:hypothetical protein